MLQAYAVDNDRLHVVDDLDAQADTVVWVDLLRPSPEEERATEAWLGVGIPTREEMEEIEISSRLYVAEDNRFFMTATLPAQTEGDRPEMAPVSFILSGDRLATVRYHEPRAFQSFSQHAQKDALGCTGGETVLVHLLETIVDRIADVLERAGRDIHALSQTIFRPSEKKAASRDRNFQRVLRKIGSKGNLVSDVQDSLLTLQRLVSFLGAVAPTRDKETRARVKTLGRDVHSLSVHATAQSEKIGFLLDATLGMINIEQSAIIKIFSVVAVIFLPPTLVASIYGMNFVLMPELEWSLGYPLALGMMVLSALLPFWYFKRRGWL